MRKFLLAASLAALALTPAWAVGQGPIRQGLRATGEAAARGTRAVAQGTGRVLQGTADATRNVVGGAVDATGRVVGGAANATRAVVGGTARGVAAGVDAVTPDLPLQARAGANLSEADRARDARWRFAQHNGEWWYYGADNQWQYHRDGNWTRFDQETFAANPNFSGEYATGYRGMEGDAQPHAQGQYNSGQAYTLRHDQDGREYICDNGQRVYFDQGQQGQYQDQQGQQEWGADQQGQQPSPTPAIPSESDAGRDGMTGSANAQTPAPPLAGGTGGGSTTEGGASPDSPRDINQSTPPGTQGMPNPTQQAQ